MLLTIKLETDAGKHSEHKKKWGDRNDFPPKWIDVSDQSDEVEKIIRNLIECKYLSIELRTISDKRAAYIKAALYFGRNNGFAVGREYIRSTGWVQKYYKFGCQHKNWQSRKLGRCYYENTCLDCGESERVDSGD